MKLEHSRVLVPTGKHTALLRVVVCVRTHIFLSVGVGHAAVQSAVLEVPQVAVVHQEVQDGGHLTEDQNLTTSHNHTHTHARAR